MDRSHNFWTPSLQAEFHRKLASLRQLTEIPSEPRAYPLQMMSQSQTHSLSTNDEIRIADCISFLAHCKEGGKFVSTVTLREHPDRLQVVLAGNTKPSSSVCEELTKITAQLSNLSREGGLKHTVRELLDMVLCFSSSRILGRLRPSWMSRPRRLRSPQLSLQENLRDCIKQIREISCAPARIAQLLELLEDLMEALKLVDHRVEINALPETLKTIVMSCAQLARLGSTNSIEEHLKSLGFRAQIAESSEIRQVDKLARYFFTCRDLARLSKEPSYRHLFSHIEITTLESSPRLVRPGSVQNCFVHAEIQQVFYLEKQPHAPAPRAIGCSKSACYLCDLFIRTHGDYVVSQTHGRLYEKWTLPDVDWMDTAQAGRLQCVVQSMIRDMQQLIQRFEHGERINYRYPLESRACLPLLSGNNSSLTGRRVESEDAVQRRQSNAADEMLPRCQSLPAIVSPFIKITERDLPWNRYARMGQGPLHVQIDELSIHLEFASTATGLLSICPQQFDSSDEIKIMSALDIPTNAEINIQRPRASRRLAFGLSLRTTRVIQVEFIWETPLV
ncbi:uncharacterized protein CTRU02_215460 [Colletotrichum truncatum]|uniref:Uncharacterized protein n=1 Tax=Colletotrichum truncatum TaxID=5467 RepID=A0ACC3YCI4_COLTU|nr:uncharacterized protein CTRU02_05598 [Colletotrichum truncatum]KAF6794041.1 hypothetical protein CTRU02_05598 [Colletotrichum truncatum]